MLHENCFGFSNKGGSGFKSGNFWHMLVYINVSIVFR